MRYLPVPLLLAGCATEPILDVADTSSVSVRYDPVLVSPKDAAAKAESHCRGMNREPILVARGEEGAWRTLSYQCAGQ